MDLAWNSSKKKNEYEEVSIIIKEHKNDIAKDPAGHRIITKMTTSAFFYSIFIILLMTNLLVLLPLPLEAYTAHHKSIVAHIPAKEGYLTPTRFPMHVLLVFVGIIGVVTVFVVYKAME